MNHARVQNLILFSESQDFKSDIYLGNRVFPPKTKLVSTNKLKKINEKERGIVKSAYCIEMNVLWVDVFHNSLVDHRNGNFNDD